MKIIKDDTSMDHLTYVPLIQSKSRSSKRTVLSLVLVFAVPYLLLSACCPIWYTLQSDGFIERSLNDIPHCPCLVNTTWDDDQFGFNVDPACDARQLGFWNCRFHQGAKGCYRQKSKKNSAGAQCCYDEEGQWIRDWKKGAGTLDLYYPETLRNLSTYQHFFSDFLSYISCCYGATKILNSCEHYMRYRPHGRCLDFSPHFQQERNDSGSRSSEDCSLKSDCSPK